MPNREIDKFYKIADLFLMPSRGEGFPRVLLEAMACKTPIIATSVDGNKDKSAQHHMKEYLNYKAMYERTKENG